MKATAKELRIHSRELLEAVSRGEDVVITFRGKPCAKLVPYETADRKPENPEDNQLFGLWSDRNDLESVEDYLRNCRQNRFS